jgi:hypothetical protein
LILTVPSRDYQVGAFRVFKEVKHVQSKPSAIAVKKGVKNG